MGVVQRAVKALWVRMNPRWPSCSDAGCSPEATRKTGRNLVTKRSNCRGPRGCVLHDIHVLASHDSCQLAQSDHWRNGQPTTTRGRWRKGITRRHA